MIFLNFCIAVKIKKFLNLTKVVYVYLKNYPKIYNLWGQWTYTCIISAVFCLLLLVQNVKP